MKLRYIGGLEKTLVDVAHLAFGKVIDVEEELAERLKRQWPAEWEDVFGDEEADAPRAEAEEAPAPEPQEDVVEEVVDQGEVSG